MILNLDILTEQIFKDFIYLGNNVIFDCIFDLTSIVLPSNKYTLVIVDIKIP